MVINNSAKTHSLKVQNLLENQPERCTDLLLQYQEEAKNPKSLAAKIGPHAFLDLHADLQPGELPWPSACQAAIEQAKAKK